MQDRFKFRSYGRPNSIIEGMQNIYTFEETEGGYFNVKVDKGWLSFVKEEDLKIMQCTGLKDKNGKLIYEGDILDLYVSSKKLYRYEVKYEIGSFMLVSQDKIFDFPNVWNDNVYPLSQLYYEYQNEENCIYECEIIGNIYENPELLEKGT
uniref:YopX protein n=1 Tax=Dulem virus 31 TaxID=3145749 RepID=A0AAU8AU89_9VIRU